MRQDFARAAESYDSAAALACETGMRMAERLDFVRIAPGRVADVGCATGDGLRELQRRFPSALPLAIDFARPMLSVVHSRASLIQRLRGRAPLPINADVRALPLAAGSLGLVWSNLMLHWLDDPVPAFSELQRVLEVGGLLMFSMLGPDTLKELRAACGEAGLVSPLRQFHDMHDLGDMLVAAGFGDPGLVDNDPDFLDALALQHRQRALQPVRHVFDEERMIERKLIALVAPPTDENRPFGRVFLGEVPGFLIVVVAVGGRFINLQPEWIER